MKNGPDCILEAQFNTILNFYEVEDRKTFSHYHKNYNSGKVSMKKREKESFLPGKALAS